MAKKKRSTPKSEPGGQDAAPPLPPGVKLVRTLRGHEGWIGRIAWSPDGRLLASPSADQTIRLWDAETGQCLSTLRGHGNAVLSVAFDPTGHTLASASNDLTVKLWDVAAGQLRDSLRGHKGRVTSVAFDPSGRTLASAGNDKTVKLWDAASGQLLRSLEGHESQINTIAIDPSGQTLASASGDRTVRLWDFASGRLVATLARHGDSLNGASFDPQGRTLASAGSDRTVKLWDAVSGELLRTLEGHTAWVKCVAFSFDGRLLASKGTDNTIKLWRGDTGACVATVPEPASTEAWHPGLAFHPRGQILATVGSDPGTPQYGEDGTELLDRVVHIWELDFDLLLARAETPAVAYTSAKIVLVGDSGVGKTGLGWRLAHGAFEEHASTHGQQFWVLHQLSASRRDGAQCEAVLWDLAGQPDYRLIHALFLDDADLALVLFDPTDSRDPLHGVEFWLKQLNVGQAPRPSGPAGPGGERPGACLTLLVAARCDRGTATLTRDELEAYCRRRGIRSYVSTSAKVGEGVDELIQRMKALIPWDGKPATVTTDTFKRIKDYVLGLKENRGEKQVIVSPPELHRRLEEAQPDWPFTDQEMMTAVSHLENHGYVKLLRTTRGESRILLLPDLLNNLAASFVLEARRNPKGLGALEEKRLLAAEYPFRELEGLSQGERDILLDSAALLFLEHNVCFRETDPLISQSYLAFPELINLKKPAADDDQPTEDGVAYTAGGAAENVYASLVVLLGYTHTFTRTDQWRNHARYEVGDGLVCGFRLDAERDGELDFVLYFGTNVGRPVRMLFQSLFESFLARRNLTVFRYEPVACPQCGAALERAVVRARLRDGKAFAFCNDCGEKLTLPRADEPIQLTRQQQAEVETQRRVADLRTRFEQAVFRVQTYVKGQGIPTPECFISYAWGDSKQERWVERNLATDLQKAGLGALLDRWHNPPGASVSRFVERIEKCDRVIVVGTPLYRRKYDNKDTTTGHVVASEVDMISNRLLGTEAQKETVLPLLLEGEKTASLPPLLHSRVFVDVRDEQAYFTTTFDLILRVYRIPPNDQAVADLRESLHGTEWR